MIGYKAISSKEHPVPLSVMRAGGKRETGESPVRARHCKPGAHDQSLELPLIGF